MAGARGLEGGGWREAPAARAQSEGRQAARGPRDGRRRAAPVTAGRLWPEARGRRALEKPYNYR